MNKGILNILRVIIIILGITITGNVFANTSSNMMGSRIQNNPDGSQTLLGHMPQEVSTSTKISHADANQILELRVIVPLSNQAQLSSLLNSIYDPSSLNFHKYITPAQFAQQFGPSVIDTTEVKEFFASQGLSVTSQSSNGFILHVAGPVNAVEQAFKLHINNYQKSDGTKFYAPDVNPSISVQITGKISAIVGLDNLIRFKSDLQKTLPDTKASLVSSNLKFSPMGTGPGGSLSPADISKAYNLTGIPSNGTGQVVALTEFDGYLPSDIATYESQFNLPNVPLQNILIDGVSGVSDGKFCKEKLSRF